MISGRRKASVRVALDIREVEPPDVPAPEAALPRRVEEKDLMIGRPRRAAVVPRPVDQRPQIDQRPPSAVGAARRDVDVLTTETPGTGGRNVQRASIRGRDR